MAYRETIAGGDRAVLVPLTAESDRRLWEIAKLLIASHAREALDIAVACAHDELRSGLYGHAVIWARTAEIVSALLLDSTQTLHAEPALADVMSDPLLHILLGGDDVKRGDLEAVISRAQQGLRAREAPPPVADGMIRLAQKMYEAKGARPG
jgi:hypothetical protein